MKPNYSLTKQQKEFAIRTLELDNHEQAYREIYALTIKNRKLSETAIKTGAARMLQNPDLQAFVKDVRDQLSGTSLVDLQAIIIHLKQLITADPNELSQTRRECCRYCYGKQNQYQWAEWEFAERREAHVKDPKKHPMPDIAGGFGWHPHREPVADCPRCYGDGLVSVWLADTRNLSPMGRKLYAGSRLDKNGNIEIVMRSQEVALGHFMRIMGAWNPVKNAAPGEIRNAADNVDNIIINLINSPDDE